jgi:hypothetical protein
MATEDDYTEERLAEYDAAAIAQDDVIVMGFVTVVRNLRARVETMRRAVEFCGLRGTCPRCAAEDPDRYVDARPHDAGCMLAPPTKTENAPR